MQTFVMESFPTPYPVVFFDGEQEQDKGFVDINSVLTFKRFQSLISQKMGLPPNQLSAVFICRRMIKDMGKWQRFPITIKTNFNTFLSEHNPNKDRDSYFLVSMKKPKRERKGSKKWVGERDPRDDWMFKCTRGVRGQNNEKIEPGEDSSTVGKMTSTDFSGDSKGHNREENNNKVGKKIILKRPAFPTKGMTFEELHASQFKLSNGDMVEQIVQNIQSQGHLHHGEYNWNHFSRHEQSAMQTSYGYSSIIPSVLATQRMKLEYHHHNSVNGYNSFIVPEEAYNKNGSSESLYQDSYRNGSIDWIYNIPKNNRSLGSYDEELLEVGLDWSYKKGAEYPKILTGILQDTMTNNMGLYQYPPSSHNYSRSESNASVNVNANANANQGLRCHVCFDCKNRNVTPIPFHWCVQDAVTKGFQGPSPAGPIGKREEQCVGTAA